MDLTVLRKKISSYKTSTGKVTRVPDELIMEILHSWEEWKGPARGFYTEIGVSHNKMASIIGRGKKLKRDGVFPESDFKEVQLDNAGSFPSSSCGIELIWDNNKVIRFATSELLLDFLKKAA